MNRPTLIDMNPFELKYYQFMISLNKCAGNCNVLSPKICVPKEKKDINVKAFHMITNKNEMKVMTEHILCDCKCKFSSTGCNSKYRMYFRQVSLEGVLLSASILECFGKIFPKVPVKKGNL